MMKMNRLYALLSLFACVVLAGAAVWMGGLNQDEGWYLYAANLVSEGRVLYRDFFYTQAPMMPLVYSAFTDVWRQHGILGARLLTLGLGLAGVLLSVALARRLVPAARKNEATLVTFLLLGVNLYHLYYLAIPKTYALASLFIATAFFLLSYRSEEQRKSVQLLMGLAAGLALAFAAGTRISLGAILPVVGLTLLVTRQWSPLVGFCLGGFGALALVFGPFLLDAPARAGLLAAQTYHAARGGFDLTWTIGSLSRLVRWYLPIFIVLGLGGFRRNLLLFFSFLAVFLVQMLAPFPYEDYQVPIMGLLAVFASVNFVSAERPRSVLLVLGLAFACSFGSPLLEKWATNGQDRFWSLKKPSTELAQLRDVARRIEALDPQGKELFTQDIYLAIETNRKVPQGFEMGPFSVLSEADYARLCAEATSPVAALSGYSFAIDMPAGVERPIEQQMANWATLKKNYQLADRVECFGQNATTLLILKRK